MTVRTLSCPAPAAQMLNGARGPGVFKQLHLACHADLPPPLASLPGQLDAVRQREDAPSTSQQDAPQLRTATCVVDGSVTGHQGKALLCLAVSQCLRRASRLQRRARGTHLAHLSVPTGQGSQEPSKPKAIKKGFFDAKPAAKKPPERKVRSYPVCSCSSRPPWPRAFSYASPSFVPHT